jgi:hypothetical protein
MRVGSGLSTSIHKDFWYKRMVRCASAFILPCLVILTTLTGCSSSHTLQFDATQPVYFGNAPSSRLPLDSAHVAFVRYVTLSSSHQYEKEPTSSEETVAAETDRILGDIATQLEDSLNHDQSQFIGNATFQTDIEADITWSIDLFSIFFGSSSSEGSGGEAGQSSTETIGVAGSVYKNLGGKR